MVARTQCHYLKPRRQEQCTAEAVHDDPDNGPLLCARHLAAAMQLVRDRNELVRVDKAYDNLANTIRRGK